MKILSDSERLVRGIGDANAEKIYRVTVTLMASQREAAMVALRRLRRELVREMTLAGPTEEEALTRALCVMANVCGQFQQQFEAADEVLPPVRRSA